MSTVLFEFVVWALSVMSFGADKFGRRLSTPCIYYILVYFEISNLFPTKEENSSRLEAGRGFYFVSFWVFFFPKINDRVQGGGDP